MSDNTKSVKELLDAPTVHHCGVHGIATLSHDEIMAHHREVEHLHVGYKACKDCGLQNIQYSKKMKLSPSMTKNDIPVYCEACLDRIVKEQQVSKK